MGILVGVDTQGNDRCSGISILGSGFGHCLRLLSFSSISLCALRSRYERTDSTAMRPVNPGSYEVTTEPAPVARRRPPGPADESSRRHEALHQLGSDRTGRNIATRILAVPPGETHLPTALDGGARQGRAREDGGTGAVAVVARRRLGGTLVLGGRFGA